MKIRPNGAAYFLMAVSLFALVFLTVSLTYAEMKVKLMPVLVSAMTLFFAVVAMIQELRRGAGGSGEAPPEEMKHGKKNVPLSHFMNAFGWFMLQIVGAYILGFFIAIPLWIFLYLWKHDHRWWSALLQGTGAMVVAYLVFVVLLEVELYPGLAWQFLSSRFGA